MPLKWRTFHHRLSMFDALVETWAISLDRFSSLSGCLRERDEMKGRRGCHGFFLVLLVDRGLEGWMRAPEGGL